MKKKIAELIVMWPVHWYKFKTAVSRFLSWCILVGVLGSFIYLCWTIPIFALVFFINIIIAGFVGTALSKVWTYFQTKKQQILNWALEIYFVEKDNEQKVEQNSDR